MEIKFYQLPYHYGDLDRYYNRGDDIENILPTPVFTKNDNKAQISKNSLMLATLKLSEKPTKDFNYVVIKRNLLDKDKVGYFVINQNNLIGTNLYEYSLKLDIIGSFQLFKKTSTNQNINIERKLVDGWNNSGNTDTAIDIKEPYIPSIWNNKEFTVDKIASIEAGEDFLFGYNKNNFAFVLNDGLKQRQNLDDNIKVDISLTSTPNVKNFKRVLIYQAFMYIEDTHFRRADKSISDHYITKRDEEDAFVVAPVMVGAGGSIDRNDIITKLKAYLNVDSNNKFNITTYLAGSTQDVEYDYTSDFEDLVVKIVQNLFLTNSIDKMNNAPDLTNNLFNRVAVNDVIRFNYKLFNTTDTYSYRDLKKYFGLKNNTIGGTGLVVYDEKPYVNPSTHQSDSFPLIFEYITKNKPLLLTLTNNQDKFYNQSDYGKYNSLVLFNDNYENIYLDYFNYQLPFFNFQFYTYYNSEFFIFRNTPQKIISYTNNHTFLGADKATTSTYDFQRSNMVNKMDITIEQTYAYNAGALAYARRKDYYDARVSEIRANRDNEIDTLVATTQNQMNNLEAIKNADTNSNLENLQSGLNLEWARGKQRAGMQVWNPLNWPGAAGFIATERAMMNATAQNMHDIARTQRTNMEEKTLQNQTLLQNNLIANVERLENSAKAKRRVIQGEIASLHKTPDFISNKNTIAKFININKENIQLIKKKMTKQNFNKLWRHFNINGILVNDLLDTSVSDWFNEFGHFDFFAGGKWDLYLKSIGVYNIDIVNEFKALMENGIRLHHNKHNKFSIDYMRPNWPKWITTILLGADGDA